MSYGVTAGDAFTVAFCLQEQDGLDGNPDAMCKSCKNPKSACQCYLDYVPLCTCSSFDSTNRSASKTSVSTVHTTRTVSTVRSTYTDDYVSVQSSVISRNSQASLKSNSSVDRTDESSQDGQRTASQMLKELKSSESAASQNEALTKSSTSFTYETAELLICSVSSRSVKTENNSSKRITIETRKSSISLGSPKLRTDVKKEDVNFLKLPSKENLVPPVDTSSTYERSESSYRSVAVNADVEWTIGKELEQSMLD